MVQYAQFHNAAVKTAQQCSVGNNHERSNHQEVPSIIQQKLGGGLKYLFMSTSNPAEMIRFDDHMFQMEWFNHHLEREIRITLR